MEERRFSAAMADGGCGLQPLWTPRLKALLITVINAALKGRSSTVGKKCLVVQKCLVVKK